MYTIAQKYKKPKFGFLRF